MKVTITRRMRRVSTKELKHEKERKKNHFDRGSLVSFSIYVKRGEKRN